jgi:hypothetical protein
MKSAMLQLHEAWPRSVRFTTLLATARSQFHRQPSVFDTGRVPADAARLAEPLLRCFATTQVNLSVSPPRFTLVIADHPAASELACLQAENSNCVTNLKHETVRLSDLQRHVLRLSDGTRDREQLLDVVCGLAKDGEVVVHVDTSAVTDIERLRNILSPAVDRTLDELAKLALLRLITGPVT